MRLNALLRWVFLIALLPAGLMSTPQSAQAQSVSCTANGSNVNFGTIDPSQPADSTNNGSVAFTCSSSYNVPVGVTACLNIGAGSSVSGSTTPRDMDGSTTPPLRFQLYRDPALTQIWGSVLTPATPSPIQVTFYLAAGGSFSSPSYPIYGRVAGNQSNVAVNTYQNNFSGASAALSGLVSTTEYPASCGNTAAIPFPFTVSATVKPTCTVSASDLNFGNVSDLLSSSNHDGTTTIAAQCVSGTAYKIGLDNGLHSSGSTRRMAGPGGQLISYELYRNSGRSQRWGNTPGTDTVNANGNGTNQNATVYGRVPVQTTPSAGNYSDTITITVTY